jgi:hypothetical protein
VALLVGANAAMPGKEITNAPQLQLSLLLLLLLLWMHTSNGSAAISTRCHKRC